MPANLAESIQNQIHSPLHSGLIGVSAAMDKVRALIRKVAPSNLTVLITGETGTGKDLAARMIYAHSARKNKPFVKVNCPSVQETLFESEFFGYERGAFTGASVGSAGWIEKANDGTLFLDEISEISSEFQGKLSQVFDGEPFMRVGGVKEIFANARILSATNIPLERLVDLGKIGESMLFRLAESVIQLLPLRERPEDIPIIAEHFNYNLCAQYQRDYAPIPDDILREMQELEWRGNVRELAGRLKEYLVSDTLEALTRPVRVLEPEYPEEGEEDTADPPETVETGRRFVPLKLAVQQAVEKAEISLIQDALEYTRWNRRKAARLLDISYSSLLRRIDLYGIGK